MVSPDRLCSSSGVPVLFLLGNAEAVLDSASPIELVVFEAAMWWRSPGRLFLNTLLTRLNTGMVIKKGTMKWLAGVMTTARDCLVRVVEGHGLVSSFSAFRRRLAVRFFFGFFLNQLLASNLGCWAK